MSDFSLWFTTGVQHILDINGYDHILYVMALCIMYTAAEWKNLLVLITAFTIGHSATLACSTLGLISVKQGYIEVLIPLTITSTCIYNLVNRKKNISKISLNYFLALFFGFIHGMGFSYLLRSMLGHRESIWQPLLYFNLGLEAGQLVVVSAMLLISVLLYRYTTIRKPAYVLVLSPVIMSVSLYLLFNRLNEL